MKIQEHELSSWEQIAKAVDYLDRRSWVFRGMESVGWTLETSIEREFSQRDYALEQTLLYRFLRTAPRFLPSHLVPEEEDTAAWLGLLQHYGGPTRLLDVTRSPYVALFFAYETNARTDRALWAFDFGWIKTQCAEVMATREGKSFGVVINRLIGTQHPLIYSLVNDRPFKDELFEGFKKFAGVFSLDPWKPDIRQSAQQAQFLVMADVEMTFVDNLACLGRPEEAEVVHKFVLPNQLREHVLDRLSAMNVNAATLFPDLGGLARSMKTLMVRSPDTLSEPAPWDGER